MSLDNACDDCGGSFYAVAVNDEGCGTGQPGSSSAGFRPHAGGGIFYATSTYTMELTLTRMTEQARHDYTLAYAPTGNNHSPKFHSLRVTAIPGYRATTRSGYYTKGSDAPNP